MGFHLKFCYKLKMRICILVIFLNFLLITNIFSEERENELNKLFIDLKEDNINLAFKTEQKIWKIWSTHPTDKNLTLIMQKGSNLININKPNDAINIFTNLIKYNFKFFPDSNVFIVQQQIPGCKYINSLKIIDRHPNDRKYCLNLLKVYNLQKHYLKEYLLY